MATGYVYPTDDGISTVSWRPHYRPMNSSCSDYSIDNFETDQMQSGATSPSKLDEEEEDERSLDSFDGNHTFVPISRHSPVSDDDLVKIPVRELNQRLQGFDRQVISALKQKRRTLKNRGYAYKCRVRRLQVQLQLETENAMLKADLARSNQRLVESQHMKNELFMLRKEVNRLRAELYGEQNAHNACYETVPSANNGRFYHSNNTPLDNDIDSSMQDNNFRNGAWAGLVPNSIMSNN